MRSISFAGDIIKDHADLFDFLRPIIYKYIKEASFVFLHTKQLMTQPKYLIIGGSTKCATTSLFKYLSDHPQVIGSAFKETRFFLDADYPLKPKISFSEGLAKYIDLFQPKENATIHLEATPDYLYSAGTPERVKSSLSSVRWIFILREPVSRIESWYKFARQNNLVNETVSFEDYVNTQLENEIITPDVPQHARVVDQSHYAKYLKKYEAEFSKDNILLLIYEELKSKPAEVMHAICRFADIDSSFYAAYQFEILNTTHVVKNARLHENYRGLKRNLRQKVFRAPFVHSVLRSAKRIVEPIYLTFNAKSKKSENNTLSEYRNLYKDDRAYIEEWIGRKLPWQE